MFSNRLTVRAGMIEISDTCFRTIYNFNDNQVLSNDTIKYHSTI